MNEKEYLTGTTTSWQNGGINFDFNLSRTFQIKIKKGFDLVRTSCMVKEVAIWPF